MEFNFFNRNPKIIKEIPLDYKPSMSGGGIMSMLTERFKGIAENKKAMFPADLGEEHPFDFKQMENLYKKFGLFSAVVDKYVDFIWGSGFYIKCNDDRAKEIIDAFLQDINFDNLARHWTKEALVKGNGFMEIGGDKKDGVEGLKVLNANNMYVVRDEYGVVEGYNQYIGDFKRFDFDKLEKQKKITNFSPDEIAHVPFNLMGDCPYGLGIGYTAMKFIDDFLTQDSSVHTLMKRKANAPLHAKFGKIDGDTKIIPKSEDVATFGQDLETMDNKTNWVTDPLVEFKVIDFGNIGDKFEMILEHDLEKLIYAFQIPAVLLGKANIPEGLAKVQMEGFQRRIQSIQSELEKIIEEKIFKRILIANGFDVHVEFEWGTPSVMEVEARMKLIAEMMKSPGTSGAMNFMLEDEMINLLKLDKDEWELKKIEQQEKEKEERKRLEAQPQPIVPGQNANFPQKSQPKEEQPKQPIPKKTEKVKTIKKKLKRKDKITTEGIIQKKMEKPKNNYEYEKSCPHCEESTSEISDINEWIGFNYKEYLANILEFLGSHDFSQIKGVTETQLAAGYLTEEQTNKLRGILDEGFKKGKSLQDMANKVKKEVGIKDLYRMVDENTIKTGATGLPILASSADKRPMNIVRSEVTRTANAGALKFYKQKEIRQVRWIASYGKRTCPICEDLNNHIYEINSVPNIPAHSNCRCTIVPVAEVR